MSPLRGSDPGAALAELPLGEQIGLDLLAAALAGGGAPVHLVSHDERRAAAARERLGPLTRAAPAPRVLWLAAGPAGDETPPWHLVAATGTLALLAPGRLAGPFDRLRRRPPRRPPALGLPPGGPHFRAELAVGIGGLESVLWSALVAAARRGQRHDLADRFEYRYRRALAPRSGWHPSELVAAVLRRVD
jgi:hypothetical protein